jgi:hypothetical protein
MRGIGDPRDYWVEAVATVYGVWQVMTYSWSQWHRLEMVEHVTKMEMYEQVERAKQKRVATFDEEMETENVTMERKKVWTIWRDSRDWAQAVLLGVVLVMKEGPATICQ